MTGLVINISCAVKVTKLGRTACVCVGRGGERLVQGGSRALLSAFGCNCRVKRGNRSGCVGKNLS